MTDDDPTDESREVARRLFHGAVDEPSTAPAPAPAPTLPSNYVPGEGTNNARLGGDDHVLLSLLFDNPL